MIPAAYEGGKPSLSAGCGVGELVQRSCRGEPRTEARSGRGRENRSYSREETIRWQIWESVLTRWRRWWFWRMWEGLSSTKHYKKIKTHFIMYSGHSRKECGNPFPPLNLKEVVICELMNLGTISYTILYTLLIDTQENVEQNIHLCSIFNICRVLCKLLLYRPTEEEFVNSC